MKFPDIIVAFFYLLPGFLFLEIYRRFFPARKDRDFARILYSFVASLFIVSTAYVLNHYFKLNIIGNSDYSIDFFGSNSINYILSFYLYGSAILFGYVRVGFLKLRLYIAKKYDLDFLGTKPDVLWVKLQKDNQWGIFILSDETRYLGYIKDYTYNPNFPDEVDLLIAEAECVDEKLKTKYRIPGKGVYIKLSNINRIEFLQ
ncbi:MAG: DUF6338 family protein [Leptospirales bacterium]